MRIAIIGRSELLYNVALQLAEKHDIPLVVTAKETPEYKVTAHDYELFAKKRNAIFINSAKINSPENIEKIKNILPIDIAISINYSGIISKEVIDLFSIGILNAHGGDLPRYRGNACQAWAILNGEDKIGLCVHKMIGGELDSGNIIARAYLPISINTRVGEAYQWMEETIPHLMLDAVEKLEKNHDSYLEKQSQNTNDILRCYPRIPDDGRINWTKTNEEILRLVNASSEPFQGAFCYVENEKIIILRAELYRDDEIYLAVPGQVAQINKDGSIVAICGTGKLKITLMKKNNVNMNPSEFIKSLRTRLI